MNIRTAEEKDIPTLIAFRFAYLEEDTGLSAEEKRLLDIQLPDYFARHLGRDMTAYLAEEDGAAVATVFLVRLEKPGSLHFLNGRTAYLMNVFTLDGYRHRGYGSALLARLFADARAEGITCIDASSTPAGKQLYLTNGFYERVNTEMRREMPENRK